MAEANTLEMLIAVAVESKKIAAQHAASAERAWLAVAKALPSSLAGGARNQASRCSQAFKVLAAEPS